MNLLRITLSTCIEKYTLFIIYQRCLELNTTMCYFGLPILGFNELYLKKTLKSPVQV